jgi:Ribonuclease G/E
MSRRLLVAGERGPLRAALMDSARSLEGFWQFGPTSTSLIGDCFLGRVAAIDRGLDAAFVDIGLAKPGFLPLSRVPSPPVEGQSLQVEVTRDPHDRKGARLTARLSGAPKPPAGARPPLRLAKGDPLGRVMARLGALEVEVDTRRLAESLAAAATARAGAGEIIVRHRPQREWERSMADIETELAEALDPRVELPSGGWLLFEPCRTLTVIDVNSGAAQGGEGEQSRFKTDLEAARAIARQLRLRHIGGIVVIDFIDLNRPDHRRQLVERLREALADDWEPCEAGAMSRLGLVEMTRRRSGPTLAEMRGEE